MPFMPKTISIGCHYGDQQYRNARAQIVTDFQMFGRVLSNQEMKDWTNCGKRIPGDIVNWELEDWFFNKTETENVSEIEELEFEKDICDVTGKSNHIFPLKTSIQKALKLCEKVSGQLYMYAFFLIPTFDLSFFLQVHVRRRVQRSCEFCNAKETFPDA